MNKQIIIGLTTEGSTDIHFLEYIVKRTFETIASKECVCDIEIFDIQRIPKNTGENFVDTLKACASQADTLGISILCVHVDADDSSDSQVFNHKINPAFTTINSLNQENICNNLVAIVPIQMTEAWMLVDTSLLKKELGTQKSDQDLGLDRQPEMVADPKSVINDAIGKVREGLPKRRRKDLQITDLYGILGQTIKLQELEKLSS